MSKYYLVRRGLHAFAGPLTLSEFRADFKRMAFGVQDEVSGHAGPWIMMDNAERLARYYPEISRVVHDDMSESWRMSDHSSKRYTGGAKAQRTARKETQRTIILALAFLGLAIFAAVAAMWLAGGAGAFSSKTAEVSSGVTIAQVAASLNRSDHREFLSLMQTNIGEITSRHNRSKEGSIEWIPYIRAYAFLNDGAVEGVSPKSIKGNNAAIAPIDCSEKTWKKRWKESAKSWSQFVSGKTMVRAQWARLLAWDPHWVRRRQSKGWIVPHSYYQGCIQQSYRAFLNLKAESGAAAAAGELDVNSVEYQAIAARLKWLSEVSSAPASGQSVVAEKENILSLWSCYEAAEAISALGQCYETLKIPESGLSYNDERIASALLRLTIKSNAADMDALEELRNRFPKLQAGDSFTRLDYSAELKHLRNTLKLENLPEATPSEKAPADYSDVNFTK